MLSTLPKATESIRVNKRSGSSQRRGSHQAGPPAQISQGELPRQDIEGSLKSALVALHHLWSEGHRSKGVGAAGHAHPNGIHLENVTDGAVKLGGTHRAVLGGNILQCFVRSLILICVTGNSPRQRVSLPACPGQAPSIAGVTPKRC